ncbi:phage baseplate assembly protein V [Collimonas fungivorans]|uniref:phage baseplate assembly protein V n=1 Tax=Collimonas fungivorans TaxID=158899 RepID=UPI0009EE651A|nr:phage baseplate assembly protein V [Collimonas fungivorans]
MTSVLLPLKNCKTSRGIYDKKSLISETYPGSCSRCKPSSACSGRTALCSRLLYVLFNAPTTWLRWVTHRAGDARTWWSPSVGEQVVLLLPGGDLTAGVILQAVYSDAFPRWCCRSIRFSGAQLIIWRNGYSQLAMTAVIWLCSRVL